ncbi:MAG: hypothetical protein HN742_07190 [Lentisphaerae bacterium]|nr:hypothetical protein [Lentisphaerota bacterium]MBT4820605.1 hypothetical protein [Lentisphaerota bacterium]MBT5604515.1 hypothetical protein [Lentisphaerota bacterium]MBT7057671.1 hypothetical protein [Lentisphaerota bacterium]MBT7841638.1 hypothetical protein [Lentisphaerota bacterium]
MPDTPSLQELAPGLLIHKGGAICGVLRSGSQALVINPGNPDLAESLTNAGVTEVTHLAFTHHRRELADGLANLLKTHTPAISVPAAEAELFTTPDAYWADPRARWLALCSRVPYHATHIHPIAVDRCLDDGDSLTFGEWTVSVLSTPGYTDGAISLICRRGDACVAFVGDLIYRAGQVHDLYCLQRGEERGGHSVGDYHGFMGNAATLLNSLHGVLQESPDLLIPAHGEAINRPRHAVELLRARLSTVYANYVSVSALRWYFPDYFTPFSSTPETLEQQETMPPPESFVRHVKGNLWLLLSDDGHAIVTDPYEDSAVDEAKALLDSGEISSVDGIWITHYHCDHVQSINRARELFACPVLTDDHMADIVGHPERYFLTCLADAAAPVEHPTRHGETWRWRNYTLTALHFPGQTYYHSGLLAVPDDGPRLFFSGDSFTPTGIDDYCSWNRNFLGPDVGFRRCVRIMKELKPDIIFNQHVDVGFRFTDAAWDQIDTALEARERLLADLLPWPHPDFGTDEYWVRTYPYEQTATAGCDVAITVEFSNHAETPMSTSVSANAPIGWTATPKALSTTCIAKDDTGLKLQLRVPENASPGRYVIPVNITWGDRDLGSFREAIVNVSDAPDS